jgi:hypothetical protein
MCTKFKAIIIIVYIGQETQIPELAPSNFHLFGSLKENMAGKTSTTDGDLHNVSFLGQRLLAPMSSTLGQMPW